MKNKKDRGIKLSPGRVREYCEACRIYGLAELEIAYDAKFSQARNRRDKYAKGAPKKAWSGQVLGRKFAQAIAELLGLSDYLSLLEDQGSSPWNAIISNKEYQSSFLIFKSPHDSGLEMINFPSKSTSLTSASIDKISINEKWSLKLKGKPGDRFIIIFQSSKIAFQLAPLDADWSDNIIHEKQKELLYPTHMNLTFEEAHGCGWRRFIAIRSPHIPISPKSIEAGEPIISCEELDRLARRLLLDSSRFEVDQYEFEIINVST